MSLLSVRLEENTRRAIRRAIRAGTLRAAVVPLASTEQHNEHLAMSHDADCVAWICRQAAGRVFPAAVVTPVVHFGISEHWMDHPGTLTLTPETFAQVVYEICDSLRRGGIGRILLVNGHGGNRRPIEAHLEEFRAKLGIRIEFCSYWEAYSSGFVKRWLESGDCPGHSGEFETSEAMAIFPQSVHMDEEAYPAGEVRITDAKRAADDLHFFATARLASAEKGRVMMEAAVDWLAARIETLIR